MQRACYRCGVQMEDHIPFCPACGAPQIKVSSPQDSPSAAPDQPVTPQFDPGTPGSIEPPAVPVALGSGRTIQWKRFLRIVLPLAFVSGFTIRFNGLGFLVLLVSVFIAIAIYRRSHPGAITASQGMRLGAFTGLLSFGFFLVLFLATFPTGSTELRQQFAHAIQERAAGNPDPAVQRVVQFASTNKGFLLLTAFTLFVFLIFFVVSAALAGAVAAVLSRPRGSP